MFPIIILVILSLPYLFARLPNAIDPKPDFSKIDQAEDINFCTGGKTYSNASEQFEAFKESSCAPVIAITGIMSSKMQIFIYDCDLLPNEVLEHCNIMTEKNKQRFIWKPSFDYIKCKSNETDFLLYPQFDPLNPVSFEFGGKCFNALAGADISFLNSFNSTDFPIVMPDVPGVKITWYGNTPASFKDSQCGLSAIQDLGDINFGELINYQFMVDYFIDMGYQIGLNFFPLPYDWRRMQGNTEIQLYLERTLELSQSLTGKKSIIVAHSYGTMGVHEALLQMSQSNKDRLVQRFISLCGPLAGAAQMAGNLIMGETETYGPFGYSMKDLRDAFTSLTSIYDLVPKNLFSEKKSEPWAQDIMNRLSKENAWKPGTSVNFSWFPTPDQECYPFRSNNQNCGLHFYNYFENPIYQTEGELPTASYYCNYSDFSYVDQIYGLRTLEELDFIKFMNETNLTQQEKDAVWGTKELIPKDRIDIIINMTNRNQLYQEDNLNVPTTQLFSGQNQTKAFFKIQKNPREVSNKGNSDFNGYVQIETTYGDNLVALDFSLTPILKWAWEYDNGQNNSYPMEVIDYCSEFNSILTKNSEGKYTANYSKPTENRYHGIPCDGREHSDILVDQFLIKFIASVAKTADKPSVIPQSISYNELMNLKESCPHLYAPFDTQEIDNLILYGTDPAHIYPNKKDFYLEFSQPSQEFLQFLKKSYSQIE